eukprot:TRINITY_DN800_c0_g1_i4.p3 TRINITY_DN800_c0_g1~~TRINITY_DN800_c0_g1_i4.p3  ORF type:complete len:239 (+),score=23.18 TRINITY_DN800_c0_g1_i4:4362-5078(+)
MIDAGEAQRLERYLEFDKLHGSYLGWQLEQFAPYLGRRILEIGCGVGGILNRLGPRELAVGVDVEAPVLAHAAERFRGQPGYGFHHMDFATCPQAQLDQLKSLKFDTILCINVLEHIMDDLEAIRRMRTVLESPGCACLLVPAHPSLYGSYDKLDGHYRRYTRLKLRSLAEQAGFRVQRLYHFNMVGAVGWWVRYRLFKGERHGSTEFNWMLRVQPLMRRMERLLKPPVGLSLVAVLS